jgi:signal transduction histidine kinase
VRRLSHQVWLSIVGAVVLFAILVSLAFLFTPGAGADREAEAGYAAVLADLLPGPERPQAELQVRVEELARRLKLDVGVFDADGRPLAAAGRALPAPDPRQPGTRFFRGQPRGLSLALRLPDGRFFVARRAHSPGQAHAAFFALLGLFALAVVLAAWPVTRRLTRRLESLRRGVEELGEGDLAARVPEAGRDEVAALARSFNRAAGRIEVLVGSQRRMLAFASHELRSPLARLRVALELLRGEEPVKAGAARDIAELDALIGELLEASRFEALGADRTQPVDLLALAAEEAARAGAEVQGRPALLRGDARLLRRLVRNLLDNARRHGGGGAVEVEVEVEPGPIGGARLRVLDRGPGVPAADRERIFEPFYRPAGQAESGEGYGLGLALVRQIARAHGGDAVWREREGGGSVFEITLG